MLLDRFSLLVFFLLHFYLHNSFAGHHSNNMTLKDYCEILCFIHIMYSFFIRLSIKSINICHQLITH